MNARVVVAVMACVFGASALAKDEPRTAKDIIAMFGPRCPQVISDNVLAQLASTGMTLTEEQMKRACDCIGADLTRSMEAERQYTPAQFEPIVTASMKSCVAPEMRKSYIPICLDQQRQSRQRNKAAAERISDKQLAVYCECTGDVFLTTMELDLSTQASRDAGRAKLNSMNKACIKKAVAAKRAP
jgi:hypothetical protein